MYSFSELPDASSETPSRVQRLLYRVRHSSSRRSVEGGNPIPVRRPKVLPHTVLTGGSPFSRNSGLLTYSWVWFSVDIELKPRLLHSKYSARLGQLVADDLVYLLFPMYYPLPWRVSIHAGIFGLLPPSFVSPLRTELVISYWTQQKHFPPRPRWLIVAKLIMYSLHARLM